MISMVNTTMKDYLMRGTERMESSIEEITTLSELKKYACPKNMHKSEWYLECVDCPSRNGCPAGKQAVYILNNDTTPVKLESVEDVSKPFSLHTQYSTKSKNKHDEVEAIFQKEDPVRYMLESMERCSKSLSLYNRVYVWEKNYPDLKEKYHMREKFKFLFTKPYDRMTIGEILDDLYPKKKEETSMTESVQDDDISLEDFLQETEKAKPVEEVRHAIKAAETKKPVDNNGNKMQAILVKLENEKAELAAKILEIDKQIEAINIVQKLLE